MHSQHHNPLSPTSSLHYAFLLSQPIESYITTFPCIFSITTHWVLHLHLIMPYNHNPLSPIYTLHCAFLLSQPIESYSSSTLLLTQHILLCDQYKLSLNFKAYYLHVTSFLPLMWITVEKPNWPAHLCVQSQNEVWHLRTWTELGDIRASVIKLGPV